MVISGQGITYSKLVIIVGKKNNLLFLFLRFFKRPKFSFNTQLLSKIINNLTIFFNDFRILKSTSPI